MITHTDFDVGSKFEQNFVMPDKIENISFQHDGGRLNICINGVEVFSSAVGTRDCCIEINNQ